MLLSFCRDVNVAVGIERPGIKAKGINVRNIIIHSRFFEDTGSVNFNIALVRLTEAINFDGKTRIWYILRPVLDMVTSLGDVTGCVTGDIAGDCTGSQESHQ